jgi:thiamine kinase-like enzyme
MSKKGSKIRKVTFFAISWPPSFSFSNEIEHDISIKYKITKKTIYNFNHKTFKKFVFGIYEPDKTPSSRIKKKYRVMKKFDRKVVLFEVNIDNPTMLPHKKARLRGKKYCREMKSLKSDIRTKYSSRVDGYVYDVVLHVGDNDEHTHLIQKLLNKHGVINV